jgi:mRNA-degrading endonuclease RelE of RelBE toxin-antitoxin system
MYNIKIEPEALTDIQDITNWYNEQQFGLGGRFQKTAIKQIDCLNKNPHIYAIRYKQIRCVLVKKFPYMVHFFINDDTNTVEVLSVISTSRNPKIWLEKTNKHI